MARTKAEQREQTRHRLINLGREMFAEYGYANTPMEELVSRADITRGALYHHFGSKEGLFRAVFEQLQAEIAAKIEAAADAVDDDWDKLVVGCRAFLAASLDAEVQRIVLIDAPAVLGWAVWREADAQASMRSLEAVLTDLQASGTIQTASVPALTHLLSGAMNEAALWLAQSSQPQRDLDAAMHTLERMLAAFKSYS